LRRRRRARRVVLLGSEQRAVQVLGFAGAGKWIVLRNEIRGDNEQSLFAGSLVKTSLASQRLHRVGQSLHLAGDLLLLQQRLNLRFHFVQRLQPCLLFTLDMDDVEAIVGANDARGLAHRRSEGSLLELGNRASARQWRQQPAIRCAPRIFGVLLGQIGEVGAALQLLRNVVRLGPCCIHALLINFAVSIRRRCLDQDVPHGHCLGNTILILVLAVVLLQLGLADRNLVRQFGGVDQDVARLALLGHGIRALLLVLPVESLQFGIGRLDLFRHVVQRQHGVLELHLHALLLHLFGNIFVADGDCAVYQRQQFSLCDLSLHLQLELLHPHIELVLNEILISLLTDKGPSGKYHLPHLPLVQVSAKLLIADAQAHAIGFIHQRLLRDHLLRGPLHQIGHDGGWYVSLELLPAHESGLLRYFQQADVLIANLGQYPRLRDAAAKHVVEEAATGNEGDHHHHADDEKDAAQHNFLDRAGGLQKSNHALGTPEWIAEFLIINQRACEA